MSICNIDECYLALIAKEYWEQPSTDICKKIVKFLNEYLKSNPNDARAYYLRSMAKFHLIGLIPPDYFWREDSEYAKGKTWNKDDAWEDYNTAINIDSNIVSKNPNVMVIFVSADTYSKYYFRKPCPNEILDKMLKGQQKSISYKLGVLIVFLVTVSILVFALKSQKNFILFSFISFIAAIFTVMPFLYFASRKYDMDMDKLYKEYCVTVVPATYDELK